MKEEDCIQKIKKGQEDGLTYFIDHYAGLMKSVISKTLWKYPYLQDEVLNDSILAVWENISSYDSNLSSFKNWCASVARYQSIDALRKERRHDSLELDEKLSTSQHLEDNIILEEILSTLPEKDAKLFRNIFIEGYSYEETAKKNRLSLSALYSRISRGRQYLRKERKEY